MYFCETSYNLELIDCQGQGILEGGQHFCESVDYRVLKLSWIKLAFFAKNLSASESEV